MKICILGNSHIACVKRAYDSLDCNSELGKLVLEENEITFFGAHANTFLETKIDGGVIEPLSEGVAKSFEITSGGEKKVVLENFDVIVLHGFSHHVRIFNQIVNWFNKNFYSSAFEKDAFLNVSSSLSHMSKIKKFTSKTLILTPRPCPADFFMIKKNNLLEYEEYIRIINHVKNVYSENGFFFLPQDPLSLEGFVSTKEFYCKDGIGLGAKPKEDNSHFLSGKNKTHMNAEYGKLYLNKLFDFISGIDSLSKP